MRYEITHRTFYEYPEDVSQCHNKAYLLPRNTSRQTCISSDIQIQPFAVTRQEHTDYYGNRVSHFAVEENHKSLEVIASSIVDINGNINWPGLDFGNTCSQVRQLLAEKVNPETLLAQEFMLDSPLISCSEPLRAYAEPLFGDDRPFLSAVRELNEKIFNDFTFDPTFSDVSTPLLDVLNHRKGVCQDFAHLAIGCLRSLGFPARYVSGYLETLPPPGKEKLVGSDASHAWFAVFSPEEGWFELDPTNNQISGDQHIVTAWGRDYSDVAPLRGVVFGGGKSHRLKVQVDVNRINAQ